MSIMLLATSRYWFMKHATRIIGGNPFAVVLLVDGDRPLPRGDYAAQVSTEGYFDPDSDDPGMYRSEEHTSELQSLMRISYAVFCLKKKNKHNNYNTNTNDNYNDHKHER